MPKKPNITLLAMGGTIAGSSTSCIDSSYSSGKLDISELFKNIPNIDKIANINAHQVANIGSQDLDTDTLLSLARAVKKALSDKNVDGVVIVHGTDTLEESAYFLNLTINTKKPIVLTGAMRSNSSISSDGDMNIFNALCVATNKKSRKKGVLVVLNDEIHCAREVTKASTSSLNAFASIDSGKIGQVYYGAVAFYLKSTKLHTYKSEFDIENITHLPKVYIVYGNFGDTDVFVNAALKDGAKGIISAGLGNGNINPPTLKALKNASENGVFVVRSSRVGSGIINPHGEIDDKQYGFLTSDNLNPQKARILLMLALLQTKNRKKIEKLFLRY